MSSLGTINSQQRLSCYSPVAPGEEQCITAIIMYESSAGSTASALGPAEDRSANGVTLLAWLALRDVPEHDELSFREPGEKELISPVC